MPKREQIDAWFLERTYTGIAMICGPLPERPEASLEVLDFDDEHIYQIFLECAEGVGLKTLLDKLRAATKSALLWRSPLTVLFDR